MLTQWNLNKATYPHLASFARKYLSALPYSVYPERIFSEDGNLYEQKGNRFSTNTSEKFLFRHHNLKKARRVGFVIIIIYHYFFVDFMSEWKTTVENNTYLVAVSLYFD